MPAPEQVAPEPASRSRLQQAAAWSVAARITLAAAISILLSKTVAGATASRYAGARDGEALAAPPRSATAARSRPGSCASGDDLDPSEVVAVAWRNDTEQSEGQFL